MKFKRRFYDSAVNFRNISKKRLAISIIIGLLSALTIYSFFYILRESFRGLSLMFANVPKIISEEDRSNYNFFFAGLSVVFGNSIAISYFISSPQKLLSRRNIYRSRILNDQIFLNFNFSYWFTKIGLVFGIFSTCCIDFDFLPFFIIPSILLLVVMYLESWKTLSRIFGKNRYKYQLIHFITILILALGISRLNILDYKMIDEIYLKNSPIYDLPLSAFYNSKNARYDREFSFKIKIDTINQLSVLSNKQWISLNDVASEVMMNRASIREELIPFLSTRIWANGNVHLYHIKNIEAELYKVNQRRIIYNVYSEDLQSYRYENRGIKKRLTSWILNFSKSKNLNIPMSEISETHRTYNDTLKVKIGKEIRVDGKAVQSDKLIEEFKKNIDPEIVFEYSYNKETSYQDYITVISSHFQAAYELRELNRTIFDSGVKIQTKEYNNKQKKLRETYPILVIEKME